MILLTNKRRRAARQGAALFSALGAVVVVSLLLAGLLAVEIQGQRLASRTHSFEEALYYAEAGIEEAMVHRSVNGTNLATQGWALTGTNYYKSNTFGSGYYLSYLSTNTLPTVTATGFSTGDRGRTVSRTVRVTTTNSSQSSFWMAIAGKGQIELDANSNPAMITDSFDSSDPAYSTGGLYDAAKRKDNGNVGTIATSGTPLTLNANTKIYGTALTSGANVGVPTGNAVGTMAWIGAGNSGIQSGRLDKTFTMSFPAVTVPTGLTTIASIPSTLATGNYSKSSAATITSTVTVTGNVVLSVAGALNMSGAGQIVIAPGASLTLYIAAESTWSSTAPINNQTGNAKNLSIKGTSGMTAFHLMPSANSTIIGTLYAPTAQVEIGSGSKNFTWVGSVIGGPLVHFNGGWNIHFDEALNKGTGSGGGQLNIATWAEL